MDEPAVSIGLPVFNGERFLARAIDSVSAQTYRDWELLISDNGSSDESVSIAQKYAEQDPRIRLRTFGENMGRSPTSKQCFVRPRAATSCGWRTTIGSIQDTSSDVWMSWRLDRISSWRLPA